MRLVLADLKGTDGFVSKDTVAGGYGSRLRPFSRVSAIVCGIKRRLHAAPSIQMAYLAALATQRGHALRWTTDALIDGDVALVLSSLVDFRHETAWADEMRRGGTRVGFVGLAASKLPELFHDHSDFIIVGEPEEAVTRMLDGEVLEGLCHSQPIQNLNTLPFPRWDLVGRPRVRLGLPRLTVRPFGGGFPLLASRGCPEFCTYCPHRILAGYRSRSVVNIVNELAEVCGAYPYPYVVFRDPLFTQDRDRCLALCDEIAARGLRLRFECETRLDRLDSELLSAMYRVGLRAISFGVESVATDTLRKVARRPIPEVHQRAVIDKCRELGIVTAAFYVFGFLQDTWTSIALTIDYAIQLGSTFAQFKILTPYPATPLWKQLGPLVHEEDWQQFDGFTPTFTHPNLTSKELKFLLGAAYSRFYVRPTYLANYLGIRSAPVWQMFHRLDRHVFERHARREVAVASRTVSC